MKLHRVKQIDKLIERKFYDIPIGKFKSFKSVNNTWLFIVTKDGNIASKVIFHDSLYKLKDERMQQKIYDNIKSFLKKHGYA
jgi:hypothetical protein